jgi:hypothetical protein
MYFFEIDRLDMKIRNIWKLWRPIYKYTWAVWQKASYDHYVEYVSALEGATVLDIGTGIGAYIPKLNLKSGTKIIFTDPDQASIDRAMSIEHPQKDRFIFDCLDADSAIEKYRQCSHLSLIHVLSVIDEPFQFIDKCYREVGHELEVLVYLSQFNATSSKKTKSLIFGFARLHDAKLARYFKKTSVGSINNFYSNRLDT